MSIIKRAFIIVFLGLSVPVVLAPMPAVAQVIATVTNTEELIDARIAQLDQEIMGLSASDPIFIAGTQRIDELEELKAILPILALQVDSQGNTPLLQSTYDYLLAEVSPTNINT